MDRLRAPFVYYGGKGNMLGRLLPLIPVGGRPYCEPYCGAACVFFARDVAPVEVLNDLNEDIVNFFRVCQDRAQYEELRWRLSYTPYARKEFERALEIRYGGGGTPVDRAWAWLVTQNQGFGGQANCLGNWGRTFVSRCGVAHNVNQWLMRLAQLDAVRWRLLCAQIDCRDALECIKYWDNDEAVFYVDPPYHLDTRKGGRYYKAEQDDEHHRLLVECLLGVRGAVVLSCYWHPVYEPLIQAGWERLGFQTACHAAGRVRGSCLRGKGAATENAPRIETVLRNPKAVENAGGKSDTAVRQPALQEAKDSANFELFAYG